MNAGRCPHSDEMLARHLDGDIGRHHFDADRAMLGEHLQDCDACRQALARARRLDAALGEASGRVVAAAAWDGALERVLARAIAATATLAPPVAGRSQRWPRLLLGIALVAAGFFLAFAVRSPLPPAAVPTPLTAILADAVDPPTDAFAPIPAPGAVYLPRPASAPVSSRRSLRSRDDVLAAAALLEDQELACREYAAAAVRQLGLGLPPLPDHPASAAATARMLQLQAWRRLLDSGRDDALLAGAAAMARMDACPLLLELLGDARRRADLPLRLRALLLQRGHGDDLKSLAVFAMAVRLGDREVDDALRRLVRRNERLVEPLAAALRVAVPRPHRAELLLSVFADLVARGGAPDDERTARRLFANQPPACRHELLALLPHCQEAPRRAHLLLALGADGDPTLVPTLLHWLQAPSQTEALIAAYALGSVPATALGDLASAADRGSGGEQWLLRAALTQAGVPGSERWLDELELTPPERALLRQGGLSLLQFGVAAPLFRERLPAGQ